MPAFLLALALAAAAPEPAKTPIIEPGATLGAIDAGAAPTDDFGFVSWCAGAVEGYLKLKPEVLPEVRRIEGQYHPPGANLEDDMKDYADIEVDARRQMTAYQGAIQAAEKASSTSLSDQGFIAYKRGLAVWAAPSNATRARIAQEWMSWSLPAKCETTAQKLTTQASLMGEAMKPTAEAPATSQEAPAAAPEGAAAAPAETPAAPAAAATDAASPPAAPAADAATPTEAVSPVAAAPKPKAKTAAKRSSAAKKKTAQPVKPDPSR